MKYIIIPSHFEIMWLTLLGIIELSFCLARRLISDRHVLGPEDNNRRLLHIFDKSSAHVLSVSDMVTKQSRFSVALNKSPACVRGDLNGFNRSRTVSFPAVG